MANAYLDDGGYLYALSELLHVGAGSDGGVRLVSTLDEAWRGRELNPEDFCIKPGYQQRPVAYFDDVEPGSPQIFQPDVYTFAEAIAEQSEIYYIVDLGCGKGEKLEAMSAGHPEWDTLGVDIGPNYDYCIETYKWGSWSAIDLEGPFDDLSDFKLLRSLVICSDVIEHLEDPRPLIKRLATSGAYAIVISTPERDIQYSPDHMGPSGNVHHVREWNGPELKAFLEQEGLQVDWIGLTRNVHPGWVMGTQLVLARPMS